MPAVSVIVPVYNVEPYIARCVRSLFGQTLQDMEFIFVDDCTPDKSMEIMWQILKEEFPARMSQVKVFRMPNNSGQAKVRMKGISMTSGDYVIHCDSDDMVDPDAYRVLYEMAVKNDLDIVSCNYLEQCKGAWRLCRGECVKYLSSLLRNGCWSLWSKMVRRSVIDRATVVPSANFGEDVVLSIQYILLSRNIGHVDRVCYYYYDCGSSITKAVGKEAEIALWRSSYSNMKTVIDYLCQYHGYSGNEPELVLYKYSVRGHLVPYVNESYYYHLWLSSFPEINRKFVLVSQIPFETKFWFVLIYLRLYHPWKKVTGFIRKSFHIY